MQDLISFIRKEINNSVNHITPESLLEDDLSITGDDASDFIQAFGQKFNVDISDFIFSNYFYEEPNMFSAYSGKKKLLAVKHLIKAIELGKLNEETIAL